MKRRFRRRPPHWLTLAVIVALLLLARLAPRSCSPGKDETPPRLAEGVYPLGRVVDGDTIVIRAPRDAQSGKHNRDRRDVRVRLLDIDAPESVKPDHPVEPYGPEAAQFAREFLDGDRVLLRFGRRRVDQYGRLLAYVFVDEAMLNEELVRAGLARVQIYPGDESSLTRRIVKAEREAQAAGRGLWSLGERGVSAR